MSHRLQEFWEKDDDARCSFGGCTRKAAKDAPAEFPFPQRVGAMRGTPEHSTITDFENTVCANERGNLLDLMLNGGARGFSMKVGMSASGLGCA